MRDHREGRLTLKTREVQPGRKQRSGAGAREMAFKEHLEAASSRCRLTGPQFAAAHTRPSASSASDMTLLDASPSAAL
jgi:hypothetical protein